MLKRAREEAARDTRGARAAAGAAPPLLDGVVVAWARGQLSAKRRELLATQVRARGGVVRGLREAGQGSPADVGKGGGRGGGLLRRGLAAGSGLRSPSGKLGGVGGLQKQKRRRLKQEGGGKAGEGQQRDDQQGTEEAEEAGVAKVTHLVTSDDKRWQNENDLLVSCLPAEMHAQLPEGCVFVTSAWLSAIFTTGRIPAAEDFHPVHGRHAVSASVAAAAAAAEAAATADADEQARSLATDRFPQYACQRRAPLGGMCPENQGIVDTFTELQELYHAQGDSSRELAFARATAVVRAWPHHIRSKHDLRGASSVGKSVLECIDELRAHNGRLRRLDTLRANHEITAVRNLVKIHGVGPVVARKLFAAGFNSVQDLRCWLATHDPLTRDVLGEEQVDAIVAQRNATEPPLPGPDAIRIIRESSEVEKEVEEEKETGTASPPATFSTAAPTTSAIAAATAAAAAAAPDAGEAAGRAPPPSDAPTLSYSQRLCAICFEDLTSPLPRHEVAEMAEVVHQATREACADLEEELSGSRAMWRNDAVKFEICGGYRRGKPFSHDADILVSCVLSDGTSPTRDLLAAIKERLEASSFLVYTISGGHGTASFRGENSELLASGVAKEPLPDPVFIIGLALWKGKLRRVDVVVVDYDQWLFAVLGWSGSRQFERSLRLYAERERNFQLGQKGLRRMIDGRVVRDVQWRDERDIFEFLGLEYIAPEDRNA